MKQSTSLLFICLGNICRSPTVEAVARIEFARAGLAVDVASAGTENYHVGKPADRRAVAVAESNGYPMGNHRARQVETADFTRHDHLLVMDRVNLQALRARMPAVGADRVALFLPFTGLGGIEELPDPYYGGTADFERVLDLARDGIAALVRRLRHNPAD